LTLAAPAVAEAAAELAADPTALMPELRRLPTVEVAPPAADVTEPAPEETEAAVPVAEDEAVQPADVGRLVTPTGAQICWANLMIATPSSLAMAQTYA
jgi:hypothetical protein